MDKQDLEKLLEPYWNDTQTYRSIDVHPGWFQLVADCHKQLLALDPNYRIIQIKEKFGQLRYYITDNNAATDNVIYKYESLSGRTCEICGLSGKTQKIDSYRYMTVCEDHL